MVLRLIQAFGRQSGGNNSIMNQVKENAVGGRRLFSALQNGTISAFNAQTGNLHKRVRAGFKDHANNSDGNGNSCQDKICIQFTFHLYFPNRIRQKNKLIYAGGDIL